MNRMLMATKILRVSIVGSPNAGKSTLLNCFFPSQQQIAAVSPKYNNRYVYNNHLSKYSFTSASSSKSSLMDQIMEWRKSFIAKHGVNPKQEDILKDPTGEKLFKEYQALEAAEEKKTMDSILTKEAKEKKDNITKELKLWREKFEETNGRKPTRDDMFNDPVASKLFAEFQKITILDWPEDMKLMLTTKI